MGTNHVVPDWRHQASCVGEDPELFFPVSTTGSAAAQVAAAKTVCAGCPVRRACLAWSLETRQQHGVWGGLSERERHALSRRRKDGLRSVEARPLVATPAREVCDSAVMPGKWRQAGEVEPKVLFGAAAAVLLVLTGAAALLDGQARAVLPSVVGAGVLALVSVVMRQPGRRQVPAHAARVTRWSLLAAEAVAEPPSGPARRPVLRSVESSCESCRRSPGSVRVVFTDGAVFVVCPPCAGGALSVGPSHAPAGDAGGRPAA